MKMIATRDLTYATRRLKAGDDFEAKKLRDAKLLAAIGKARYADADANPASARYVPVDPRRPTMSDTHRPADELPALRERYESVVGRKPFMGWDAKTLSDKIAAAKA